MHGLAERSIKDLSNVLCIYRGIRELLSEDSGTRIVVGVSGTASRGNKQARSWPGGSGPPLNF